MKDKTAKKPSLALISIIYLAGIFMGAIDTGIVTPARAIIQNNLMVDEKTGIWMITIYTLAYAASIPVMGKLADRYGRKIIYIISISLFGLGSLMCGLSHYAGSFGLLIASRAVQAIGGGGIMPVATAEFGTSFPPEKRGMALGLVGGVYGIANIFGSLAGSAILDAFGTQNWQYIFFVNIPISIFIILAGAFALPNHKEKNVKRIDGFGTLIIVALVLSLLYGLKQIDFFDFAATIGSVNAYPFLITFAVLVPVFILVEKRAEDPIINLKYFTSGRIVTTLAVAFVSGFVMMGIVFIPQFCENSLKVASGSGGYFTVILGLLSGVSAMLSGRLIDKIGAKLVLILGFSITIIGAVFLMLVAVAHPGLATVIISLALLGFGLGFTIGAPVNYMMLENVSDSEANSGLATLSLIRSIGTSIAPAIMVGFLAYAGTSIQANLMAVMPNEINIPPLPYVQEISDKVAELKADPNMADKLGNMEMPDLSSIQTIKLDFSGNSDYEMPADIIEKLKTSDVTTIVGITKEMSERMFDEMSPEMTEKIQGGLEAGISGISSGIEQMDASLSEMQAGYDGIGQGINGMQSGVAAQKSALNQLNQLSAMLSKMSSGGAPTGMPTGATGMPTTGTTGMPTGASGTTGMPTDATGMPTGATGMPTGTTGTPQSIADMLPSAVKSQMPESVLKQLSEIKSVDELDSKIAALRGAISTLEAKIATSEQSRSQMKVALDSVTAAKAEMETLLTQMQTLDEAIPGAFETAKEDYLKELEAKSDTIQSVYQSTVNEEGYRSIYMTAAIAAAIAILLLLFYRKKPAAEMAEV
ncbi:MAG: MFS transporter [Oscillospiraceae bacterium]